MSEMTGVVETQQQQQQYVGGSSNAGHHCKDCGLKFESEKSLEVHVRYSHQENLLNQWASKAQQEESNNNHSKTGNHNSHVNANRESVSVPTDSSEPSSMSPSQDPTSSQQQQQQQQQQQPQQPQQQQQQQQQQSAIHTLVCPPYDFQTSMYSDSGYYIPNEQSYMLTHHYSPSQEDAQSNRDGSGGYPRYHPYQHQQHYSADRTTSNSTSPQSPPLQCDKCGAVYEDANQLGEHMRTTHLDSPSAYPPAPQYQQLGNSPQQLHPSPPLSNQPQQQSGYDYNGGQTNKSDMKQEPPEEQAEILDLDSHKVQTHRYEEELIRLQQQQQQGLQMQMQHRLIQQQQQPQHRIGSHSVSSMLSWPPATQPHDYHTGLGSMGPIDNVPPPIADQGQFMRGQHMPVEHGHQSSPIISSTQPMASHQIPAGFVQQPAKAPPLANQSWKSNEPRRPKTYNCTACNKWFTSSGHLKRHYNTTLHKNAVKNGKEPDPANSPISNHHHPTRENNHSGSRGGGAPTRSPSDLPSSRSPPNLMAGSVHPAMTSPTAMGGTTMPHQPYPNALPPHVTITTSTPAVLLESTQPITTMQLTTIGNEQNDQQQHQLLPSFTIFDQKNNFTQIGVLTGFVVEQNQIQSVNVGGLSAEEIAPQESFESSATTYDPYSPSRYKSLTDMDVTMMQTNEEQQVSTLSYHLEARIELETNNNHLSQLRQAKEDLDPNIGLKPKKERKSKTNSKKPRQVITTGANFISQDGIHKCIDCNKFFVRGCYLTQHNKSFHSGDKPFKCTQCGKRFPNEELYGKHVKMHTCARRHRCEACPKVFAHKTDLKRHTCIHTGKRPFKCDICDKGFIRQDHMKKHQHTHRKKRN
ncbi:Zinc finger protein 263, partial [Camponotus floridanus]